MYKTVLVPLDGSELAETVSHYAAEVAGRLGLEVVLLHVANPDRPELLPTLRAYVDHVAEVVSLQAARARKRAGIEGKPVKARGDVIGGYAADGILRYAEEQDIDLIMIASHGRSGVRRWVLGSVAERILRSSKAPVWLVPVQASGGVEHKWSLRKVLVPLDGSPLAEQVLPYVETLAKQRDTGAVSIVLLRVWEPLVAPGASTPESTLDWARLVEEHLRKVREVADRYLAEVGKRLTDAGLMVKSEVRVGEPASEIIDYAAANNFDLIAMATHGHSGFTRWSYGNVANNVLHAATVPVLLVRPG